MSSTSDQAKIAAVRAALTSAQAALDSVTTTLALLEDAYPSSSSTPGPIQQIKDNFGDIGQRWTDARNYAEGELRKL